jgi:hypothetical protein
MAIHESDSDYADALATRLNADTSRFYQELGIVEVGLSEERTEAAPQLLGTDERKHLLAQAPLFISRRAARQMAETVAAIETVVACEGYRQLALSRAPEIARLEPGPRGVFFSYDFHLNADHPQLIEINTNAGGALLNATASPARWQAANGLHPATERRAILERDFVNMFRMEWKRQRSDAPLTSVAIVDADPWRQYLSPEFRLFRHLLQQHGITAVVADRRELRLQDGGLWLGDMRIDLVYNRLTDFTLEEPESAALRQAYLSDHVVLTPHPRAHALYADKRNLAVFSDDALLTEWRIAASVRSTLRAGVPRTAIVCAENATRMWAQRRKLFFKPAAGFGGKAAYRGDKLTHRVWEEILGSDYVAQEFVPPSRRSLEVDGGTVSLKVDVRNYVFDGRVQLLAARMYEGQATNFRTTGGGFAPVYVINHSLAHVLRHALERHPSLR